jgi:pyruvate dehydrogenase E2 component (dihydrolipoamide acetyltransferase)
MTVSVNMDEAVNLRAFLKEEPAFKGISINHLVIKAVAKALHFNPRVNCSMRDGGLYQPADINVGIITAVEDGLLVPVIKNCDELSLKDIVFEARAAVDRARAGRPSSADLSGGTFSISNMGGFDIVENFTAIINPGQGGIIAVSAVQEVPVVRNGEIKVGKVMKITLSVDHRIIDGVMAANFLGTLKATLEQPTGLLI